MDVVEWHVAREQRAMYAEQRVALDADDLALRPAVGRVALAAADEVRERVVDDGHFRARRPGIEEELLGAGQLPAQSSRPASRVP